MKATVETTDRIVQMKIGGGVVPARLWQGVTENGAKFVAFVTRVAVAEGEDAFEFEKELHEQAAPRPDVLAIPARMIL